MMVGSMVALRSEYSEVLWGVVGLVAVLVMDDFTSFQTATKHLFCYDNVLIDIAGLIRSWVVWLVDSWIAIQRRTAALPARVCFSLAHLVPRLEGGFWCWSMAAGAMGGSNLRASLWADGMPLQSLTLPLELLGCGLPAAGTVSQNEPIWPTGEEAASGVVRLVDVRELAAAALAEMVAKHE